MTDTELHEEIEKVKAEMESAARIRTPERIALRLAAVGWLACLLLGFIAGHFTK